MTSADAVERPLTQEDRATVFRKATSGLTRSYGDRFATGMTDDELRHALAAVLGIFGGSGSPRGLSISYQGNGLKIWGAWHVVNHVQEKPLFEGSKTVAMAREIYGIKDPGNQQMSLL